MSDLFALLIIGVTAGSLYGLTGIGLILTYKTSGIFNFAHGAIAALAAYVFYDLHELHGVAWPIALVISVGAVGILLGLALGWLSRRLGHARVEIAIVATIGLLLLLQGGLVYRYGGGQLAFQQFLPTETVTVADVQIQYAQIIVVVVGAVVAGALFAFLTKTRLGAVMRGLVDDNALVSLAGLSPARVQAYSWMLGCSLAALSGILVAPVLGLESGLLTLLVVQAFGACAIGLFKSLPLTYVGGLIVGVLGALATDTDLVGSSRVMQGLAPSMPFLVLFVVLLVIPKGKLVRPHRRGSTGHPCS